MWKIGAFAAALVAVSSVAFAQLQVPQQPAPQQARPNATSSEAPIGSRDVLEIHVLQDPSLNTTVTVGDDGRISLPVVGKVDISGLTPLQAEMRIKQVLESKILTKADVTVQVLVAGSKPISVIGAVTRPGGINVTGNITLIQAITQAGGLAPGYGKTVYVLRTASNGLTEQIAIDVDDLMVNGNPDLNLPLAPNDVVNIPVDTPISVYIFGEVVRPGKVDFRRSQTPTLLQALAAAGAPTDRASARVVVKRMVNGRETSIKADWKKIIHGKQSDIQLLDNDTVFVEESVF
ncbi:MAG: polysaccharide biosynthesis/export protein VpsN [Acidobacteriota bacterium]|jgi:polysaccharide export outer membrane protein|nr:polysaccharide biosynthesis/export protein VpsN [Acidobacteriota bacterium]